MLDAAALLCRSCLRARFAGLVIIVILIPSRVLRLSLRLAFLPQRGEQSQLLVRKLLALAVAFGIQQLAKQGFDLAAFAKLVIQLRHQIQHHLLQSLWVFRQMFGIDGHQ